MRLGRETPQEEDARAFGQKWLEWMFLRFHCPNIHPYLLTEMIYYVTSRIASMLLGRWIGMMGMSAVSRYLGMAAGPIGWTLLAGWTLSDIASPAYRVMIPAVIMVASMRFRQTATLTQKN